MSTLPKPLQDSIEENARLAQWRADEAQKNREKEAAAAKEAEIKAKEESKTPKLKKDGTIAKKRGPKPKVKAEPKKPKTKCTEWETLEQPSKIEQFLGNAIVGFLDDVSDIFVEYLYSKLNRTRRERKKAQK